MRAIGCVIILVCAMFVSVGYRKYLTRGLAIGEGYLAFIKFLRTRITCYIEPCSESVRDYKNEMLESIGFLEKVEKGQSLYDSFCLSDHTGVPETLLDIYKEYFSTFGNGYLDLELKKADLCIEAAGECLNEEKNQALVRSRASIAVLFAISFGAILLIA